jgi:hypothetical protein
MDVIKETANRFADSRLRGGFTKYEEFIESAKYKLYDIDNSNDKIKFINILLEKNSSEYEQHKLACTTPGSMECRQNYAHETVTYYLTQELERLGIVLNDDTFTEEEKTHAESKLDQILRDLNEVKLGQQVLYEDLTKEINELRDLYFLGKKKWHQLLIGKGVDMVASGIISETVSKQLIETVKTSFPTLIGG